MAWCTFMILRQQYSQCGDVAGAVDLRNALANRFGVELPATVVYDYPTPAALSAQIAKLLAAKQPVHTAGMMFVAC